MAAMAAATEVGMAVGMAAAAMAAAGMAVVVTAAAGMAAAVGMAAAWLSTVAADDIGAVAGGPMASVRAGAGILITGLGTGFATEA